MADKLYWNTVGALLTEVLHATMEEQLFDSFRLVGGTALSLYLGHRLSVDIDLFTDAKYDSIDFGEVAKFFKEKYPYVFTNTAGNVGIGTSYNVGMDESNAVKVDVYYNEKYLNPPVVDKGVRLASIDDIVAMKMHVVQGVGRKKDFWDIHALLDTYSIGEMITLHKRRYPYEHEGEAILKNFTDFTKADKEPDPVCLQGKHWETIRDEIKRILSEYRKSLELENVKPLPETTKQIIKTTKQKPGGRKPKR